MKVTRDGNTFTVEADDDSQAKTLEAIFEAVELKSTFRKGKVTVAVELDFDAPATAKPKKAPANPKANAKAKAK